MKLTRAIAAVVVVLCLSCVVASTACGGQQQVADSSSPSTPPTVLTPVPPPATGEFTIAVIPDTQCYTSKGGIDIPSACGQSPGVGKIEMMTAQLDWAVAHRDTMHVDAVVGLGDIVNCGNTSWEWVDAVSAYSNLEKADMPYSPMIGNHDYDGICTRGMSDRSAKMYNSYFPVAQFKTHSWFGTSTYPTGSMENFYVSFAEGGATYIILALELFPRDEAIAWAQSVFDANPGAEFIVTTHANMLSDASYYQDSSVQGPLELRIAKYNNAQQLWTKLIAKNSNIIAVLSGHAGGAVRRTDASDNGKLISQIQSDYQFDEYGGNGYMRILRVNPAKRTIRFYTYSPFLDRYKTDSANLFTITY